MDRQTRRKYFERLCELRDDYGRLGEEDIVGVISIEAVVEHAVNLLERPSSPMIVMLDGGQQS
jgi:hypothetical protein